MTDGPLTLDFPQAPIPPTPTPAGSAFPGYPGSVATDAQLLINGIDVTPPAEWDATWEERADGTAGQITVTIQDRTNDPSLEYGNQRDRVTLKVSGNIVFDGEITTSQLDLPPGRPWRRWKVTGTDWNTVMDLRLVGVPSGYTWLSTDGGLTFQDVDPNAHNSGTDATTVRDLFAAYTARSDGSTFDAATFVFSYIANNILNDPYTGQPRLVWSHATLKSALDEMRGLAKLPIALWIDPAGAVHWVALPDTVTPANNPAAPAAVTDTSPNGTTTVGARGMTIQYDGTYSPQTVYVNGVTDFLYNSGNVIAEGTGWAHNTSAPSLRQISVDAQASDKTQRDAVGDAYAAYSGRARIRGTVVVGRLDEKVDGWHAGQMLTITDARLPASLNGHAFPIQRVQGKLVAANNWREYTLEWGDAPHQTFSQKYRTTATRIRAPKKPAITWDVYFEDLSPAVSQTQTLTLQAMDGSKKPVRASGLACNLTLDTSADGITWVAATQGTLSAASVTSDSDGQAQVIFTTGASATKYRVNANTPAVL